MKSSATIFGILFFSLISLSTASAQAFNEVPSTLDFQKPDTRVFIEYLVGDSSALGKLIDWQRKGFRFKPLDRPMLDTPMVDTTEDSLVFEFRSKLNKLLGQKDFS